MDHWDGSVLNINATCTDLGQKSLQLLGMHALSGCDTTSCLYGKARRTALNTMVSGIYKGLVTIGDVGTTHRVDGCSNAFLCCIVLQSATKNSHEIYSLQYIHKDEEKS